MQRSGPPLPSSRSEPPRPSRVLATALPTRTSGPGEPSIFSLPRVIRPAAQPATSGSLTVPPIFAVTAMPALRTRAKETLSFAPGPADEEVAPAGLAADQQVVTAAADQRRGAAFATGMEDVDAEERVAAAAAFEPVGDVVVAGVDRVAARAAAEPIAPRPALDRHLDLRRQRGGDRDLVVARPERDEQRLDPAVAADLQRGARSQD